MLNKDILHALMDLQTVRRDFERKREAAHNPHPADRREASEERRRNQERLLGICEQLLAWRRDQLATPEFTLMNSVFGQAGRIPIYADYFWHGLPVRPNRLVFSVITFDGPDRAFYLEEINKGEVWEKSTPMTRCGELFDRLHPDLLYRLETLIVEGDPWALAKEEIARIRTRYAPVG